MPDTNIGSIIMKHTRLFLFIIAVFVLCSCEKNVDDRQGDVPKNPSTVWLLGLQVTKIPREGRYYECKIPGCSLSPKQLKNEDIPYYFRIDGGKLIDASWEISVYHICHQPINICSFNSNSILVEPDTLLKNFLVPNFHELDSLNFPQEIKFNENGIAGTLIIKYVK